jgi:phosphosulfolactate synthase (CoM biosynthesis protein A)
MPILKSMLPKLVNSQLKVLKALYECEGYGMNILTIAESIDSKAKKMQDLGCNLMQGAIGYTSEEARKRMDEKNKYLSLLTLKYIEIEDIEIEGRSETIYKITPKGRMVYEALADGNGSA